VARVQATVQVAPNRGRAFQKVGLSEDREAMKECKIQFGCINNSMTCSAHFTLNIQNFFPRRESNSDCRFRFTVKKCKLWQVLDIIAHLTNESESE
jgi:hypothetical protein